MWTTKAVEEFDEFVQNLAERIVNVKFEDDVVARYWEAVKHEAPLRLLKFLTYRPKIVISDLKSLENFQAALERPMLLLSAAEEDELAYSQWLISATKSVLNRLEAINHEVWRNLN